MTSVPFAAFKAEILALYHPRLRRVTSYRKIRQVLAEFEALCPMTGDLSPATVAAWIAAHPGRRETTVRTLLGTVRAAFRYGEARGLMLNPFKALPLARCVPRTDDEPARSHPSAVEIAKVLIQADREAESGEWRARRLRVLVYLAAYTGARASEILALRVQDIDLAGAQVLIRPNPRRALKTRRSRRAIPIAGPLRRALEPWINRADNPSEWLIPHTRLDGPWLMGAPSCRALTAVRELGRRAGVDGLTLLGFRHAFASAADAWQIGPKALQDLMGHTTPITQWHYRHTDPEELRRAADRVRFGPLSPPLPGAEGTPPTEPRA